MMQNSFVDRFREFVTQEDALWGFFGPRAHDSLGIKSFLPLTFISCCDWGEEYPEIEHATRIYSIERKGGERRNWSNRDLDASLVPGVHDELHKLLAGSRRTVNCLCYRSFKRLEDLARLLPQVRILANPVALKNKLDDKVLFRHMLPKLKVGRLKGESAPLERLEFGALENRYGLPFVIQFPFGSAGDFTFLVKEAAELNTLKKDNPTLTVNVIPFLDRPCLNINACILDDGRGPFILASPPSIQLIGLPEASSGGLTFCGNDFSALDLIPMARLIETQELTKRIGLWMASQGYRGLFGLDLLVDETCVYPVEINPRFQNSTSLLTHLSTERGDIPLTACHASEFLPGAPRPSPKERAEQSQRNFAPLEGAQIILHNLLNRPVRVKGTLRPGIYNVTNNQLRYLRPGLAFETLNGAGECLITCGIPGPQKRILPKAPLLKLQTRSQVLTPDLKRLSPWANRLVGLTTRTLKMEPEAAVSYGL